MGELAGGLHLALKTGHGGFVDPLRINEFDGHRAAQHGVAGLVHLAVGTFPNRLQQFILPQPPGGQGVFLRGGLQAFGGDHEQQDDQSGQRQQDE
jgi:hypothetical protein